LHIAVESVGDNLGAAEANTDSVVLGLLATLDFYAIFQLSKHSEKMGESILFNTLAIIGNDGFEDHLVGHALPGFLDLCPHVDDSFLLVVLDRILNDIEDNELVQPPICLDGHTQVLIIFSCYYDLHLSFLNLVLEWLEHLLDELLGLIRANFLDLELTLTDLHLLNLVRVVELQDLCRVHDLLVHIQALLVEVYQLLVMLRGLLITLRH
jgi:hypothetical protein